MYKEEKSRKEILTLASILILVVTLVVSVAVLAADYEASQVASTSSSTAISIVGKVADTAVATTTFPQVSPNTSSSAPYNNVDGSGDPQVLAAENSEPVVRLKNTSGGSLNVWLSITTWSNSIADAEDYELVATTTTNVVVVDDVLSSDGNAATVNTGVTIDTLQYKALYLELGLSSVAGKTGTSTLSVLGETP